MTPLNFVVDGKEWTFDFPRWPTSDVEVIAAEFSGVLERYKTWVPVVGVHGRGDREGCYSPVKCDCGYPGATLIEGELGCPSCESFIRLPMTLTSSNATVGMMGRVPIRISGRPISERLLSTRSQQPREVSDGLLLVKGRWYYAPLFFVWLPPSWPHAAPPVVVHTSYFKGLGIASDHIWTTFHGWLADEYHLLCMSRGWRERPMVEVITDRVAPRALLELTLSDLKHWGVLESTLSRANTSLHQAYNLAGRKSEKAKVFNATVKAIYKERRRGR